MLLGIVISSSAFEGFKAWKIKLKRFGSNFLTSQQPAN
jgi:hypothetical protein